MLAAMLGRLVHRTLATAMTPLIGACDVLTAGLVRYQVHRQRGQVLALAEAELRAAARP